MFDTRNLNYSYNDVAIKPAVLSTINSRSECSPFDENGMLPIFTAPMSAVVNEDNFNLFEENNIYPILPRNHSFEVRYTYALKGKWAAFSLNEFIDTFCNEETVDYGVYPVRALIDIANGHMAKMYEAAKTAKSLYGDKIEIMVGNIANPETYFECYKAGVQYVRVGIGGGCGCVTSSNTGIHMPLASLINEVYKVKSHIFHSNNILGKKWGEMPQIIADGGIRGFVDVIKCLALGADYAMCGSILSSLIESAGKMYCYDKDNNLIDLREAQQYIFEQDGVFIYDDGNEDNVRILPQPYKVFYGMASRQGQMDISGKKTKTSEGIMKNIPVTTNINKWVDNMKSYLRSAMSYCNVKYIWQFNPENVDTIVVSSNTKNSINK